MRLQLRPRQVAVASAVQAAFRAGHKRVMVYAPCGFGKTELGTWFLQATRDNGKHGAFIADRTSLVTQTSERFDKYDLPHGVMQAQHERYESSQPIQVCSIQTLERRQWPPGNLMVLDEAHTLRESLRKKLLARDRYAIGLSATPIPPGLGRYFDTVVNLVTTNELIAEGTLVAPTIFSHEQPNMDGVHAGAGGEWDDKETEERVLRIVGDVVKTYITEGRGEKFICFAWNIKHALEIQRQFLAAGINVATYTADDRPEDRHEDVQEFKKPDSTIRGLVSVEALTRGFDVTDVGVLIDAHPIRKAWWVYVQMLGRVMRAHPGKTRALVFDHSGNATFFWKLWNHLFEHGVSELDDGEPKEKDGTTEKEEPDPIKCHACGHVHLPSPVCPECGFEYPKKSDVVHVPGTLKEIVATGDSATIRELLWPQVVDFVLGEQRTKIEARKKKKKSQDDPVAQAEGFDMDAAQRTAQAIFYELSGTFAKARVANTEPTPVSEDVRGKIIYNRIKHARGKKKAATV